MFSKTTEYALRAVIYLAQKSSQEHKIGITEIARAISSPPSFTAKILQLLTYERKMVSSVRGPAGGFYMTDEQKQLPLRTVIELVGEEDIFEKCVLGLQECSENNPCPMHAEYKHIKKEIVRIFEAKNVGQLAREITQGKLKIGNPTKKRTRRT